MAIQAVTIGSTLDIKYHFKEKKEGLESIEKLTRELSVSLMGMIMNDEEQSLIEG